MDFDVIVVGSGQAGVPLAARLARAGKRVLIAERGELGGTCVNSGCTPTKTMIASARAAHVARTAARLGVRVGPVEVDLGAVVDRKDAVVRRWREGVQKRLTSGGDRLTLVRGEARFVAERRVPFYLMVTFLLFPLVLFGIYQIREGNDLWMARGGVAKSEATKATWRSASPSSRWE